MTQRRADQPQYWVWVAAPERYRGESGDEHPDLVPGSGAGRWPCHRDTRAGDLVVLYRSRDAKDVAYRLRASGDAQELPDGQCLSSPLAHGCEAEVLDRFARPVPLAELRADPVVATWPALRSSFARAVAPVPPDVWARLMEMAGVELEVGVADEVPVDVVVEAPVEPEQSAPPPPAPRARTTTGPSREAVTLAALGVLAASVVVAMIVRVVRSVSVKRAPSPRAA
jgi:hypothetical protein